MNLQRAKTIQSPSLLLVPEQCPTSAITLIGTLLPGSSHQFASVARKLLEPLKLAWLWEALLLAPWAVNKHLSKKTKKVTALTSAASNSFMAKPKLPGIFFRCFLGCSSGITGTWNSFGEHNSLISSFQYALAAFLFRQRLVCLKPTSWEHPKNWTSCLWQHVSRRARFTFVEVQNNFMMQPQVATNAFPRCFNETYEFYHWSRSCHDDVDDSEWCIFVDLSEHFFQIFPMRWKYPQRWWLRSGATMDLHTRKHAGCRPDTKPKRELRMLTHEPANSFVVFCFGVSEHPSLPSLSGNCEGYRNTSSWVFS